VTSKKSIVDFIVGRIARAGAVSARKMFGDYGVFCDGKMVALICDDRLFVKPTASGRAHAVAKIGEVEEASPYPGAKPCLLIPEERWDDAEWLSKLIRLSAAELPAPVKKPRKAKPPH
jgi:TfoX/Sxy family transcriptional regulator of competence genes